MTKRIIFLAIAALSLASCKNNNEKKPDHTDAAVTSEGLSQDKGDATSPPPDFYTTIPFGKLNKDERATFVKVAKAELCPCKGSTVSLDECLRDKSQACDIAKLSAQVAMTSIQQGRSETDALSDISNAVEQLKKVYTFDLEKRPFEGDENAKIKIVEFADYRCPHCKHASKALHELAKKFAGKSVAIYYKNFPLDDAEVGLKAMTAAIAAHNQGKFWEMHDLLFENQSSLSDAKFQELAKQLGLNIEKFNADMKSDETKTIIATDNTDGQNANVTGTPTIFINGQLCLINPEDIEAISNRIESELK